MKARLLAKNVLFVLTAFVFSGASLALAAQVEPIEYQASVDIDALLNEAQVNELAQRITNGHFADSTSVVDVRAGLKIYKVQCSSCHGRQLQGQSLWQAQDAYAGLRAPPHDETGHTWQHSDEDLFRKISSGHMDEPSQATDRAQAFETHAFRGLLSDESILQVLAFIKARWPLGIRVAQSTLNPEFQGMPKDADTVEWTFPPTCLSSK